MTPANPLLLHISLTLTLTLLMNKSIRILCLLTAQAISILLLSLNVFAHFSQASADILVYISSVFVGWTISELMHWDIVTGAK